MGLFDEDGQACDSRLTGYSVGDRGIAAGDDDAPPAVDAVGEVVAEPAVLSGGHARGAAIADTALVDVSP